MLPFSLVPFGKVITLSVCSVTIETRIRIHCLQNICKSIRAPLCTYGLGYFYKINVSLQSKLTLLQSFLVLTTRINSVNMTRWIWSIETEILLREKLTRNSGQMRSYTIKIILPEISASVCSHICYFKTDE